jgi:hypothetical protein
MWDLCCRRDRREFSTKDMKRALQLLKDAAGVTIDDKLAVSEVGARQEGRPEAASDDAWNWEDVESPGIKFGNYTHSGALLELADMYEICAPLPTAISSVSLMRFAPVAVPVLPVLPCTMCVCARARACVCVCVFWVVGSERGVVWTNTIP